ALHLDRLREPEVQDKVGMNDIGSRRARIDLVDVLAPDISALRLQAPAIMPPDDPGAYQIFRHIGQRLARRDLAGDDVEEGRGEFGLIVRVVEVSVRITAYQSGEVLRKLQFDALIACGSAVLRQGEP